MTNQPGLDKEQRLSAKIRSQAAELADLQEKIDQSSRYCKLCERLLDEDVLQLGQQQDQISTRTSLLYSKKMAIPSFVMSATAKHSKEQADANAIITRLHKRCNSLEAKLKDQLIKSRKVCKGVVQDTDTKRIRLASEEQNVEETQAILTQEGGNGSSESLVEVAELKGMLLAYENEIRESKRGLAILGAENEALKQKLQAYEDEKEKLQEQLSAEIGLDNSKEHLCQVMQERDALLDYLEEESSRMSSMEKTIQDLRHVKEEYDVVQSTLEREKHALAELEMELQRRDQLLIHANQTNEDRNVECEKWNKLYQNLMKETESRNEQISRELINLQENNSSLSSQVETLAKAQLELARAKAQVIALELELREERKASITFMEEEEPPAVPFSSASIPSLLPASSEPPCSIGLHECPIEAKEDIIHHPLDDNMLTLHHALIQMERDLGLKDPLDKISEPSQQLDEKLCDISWTSSPALRILSPQLASKIQALVSCLSRLQATKGEMKELNKQLLEDLCKLKKELEEGEKMLSGAREENQLSRVELDQCRQALRTLQDIQAILMSFSPKNGAVDGGGLVYRVTDLVHEACILREKVSVLNDDSQKWKDEREALQSQQLLDRESLNSIKIHHQAAKAAWEGERHVLMTELQSTATSLERENICIKNIEKRLDATMDENNRLQQHVDSLEAELTGCRAVFLELADQVIPHLKVCLQGFTDNTEVIALLEDAYCSAFQTDASLPQITNGICMALAVVATLCKRDWLHHGRLMENQEQAIDMLAFVMQNEQSSVMEEMGRKEEKCPSRQAEINLPKREDDCESHQVVSKSHADKYREILFRIRKKYDFFEIRTTRNGTFV